MQHAATYFSSEALYKQAVALEERGALMDAVQHYQQLLVQQPGHKQGQRRLNKLADKMNKMNPPYQQGIAHYGKQSWHEAAKYFEKARSILPDVPEVLTNLALSLQQLGRLKEASQHMHRALRLRPDSAEALVIMGNIQQQLGDPAAALKAYEDASKAQPDYVLAWNNMGKMHQLQKNDAKAIEAFHTSLALDGNQADILAALYSRMLTLHQWDDAEKTLFALRHAITHNSASPFAALQIDDATFQLENAQNHSTKHWPYAVAYDAGRAFPSGESDTLRIGYLSSDMHEHATAYLMAELFEQHDESQFEVFVYSTGPDKPSAARERIQQAAHHFYDIAAMASQEAAEQIKWHGIDILIDLKGHTQNSRLDIVALRPAPVQMHYLGYPGTTGLQAIDYFISDAVCTPKGHDAYFTEKVIRLPHSYQINDRKRPLPDSTISRKEYGLPEDGVVFCNFNQSYKITPDLFAVWMRVLKQTQSSVLWLLEYSTETTQQIKAHAKAAGIDPARIIMAPHAALDKHMQRYACADFVLDTSPINSHTTASDALWCGVPLVTLTGETFASRVAASLLHASQLEQLITHDLAAYEQQILALAQDNTKLNNIKMHLQKNRMELPLFDSAHTTKALEAAYLHAAQQHKQGTGLAAFSVGHDLQIS